MAKFTADSVLDAALDKVATATTYCICSQQPTTRTEAVTTYNLGSKAITGGAFTKANGDVSGRKTTVAAQTGISITATGTANHIALVDATEILHVTTLPAQGVTSGNTANVSAFDVEFADVTP